MESKDNGVIKNVVLVHGAFADGSGWEAVANILKNDGYKVSVAQPPETSYAADQKYTKAAIDAMGGPVVLVGHSYGGSIITEAGNHPYVAALVYIAAFALDEGESCASIEYHRLVHPQGYVARLENQAQLVHGGYRRPINQSGPGAHDGEARQSQDGRSERQPCGLHVSPEGNSQAHRRGCDLCGRHACRRLNPPRSIVGLRRSRRRNRRRPG